MTKKGLFFLLLVFSFILASCSHTLYPVDTLEYNYNMRMQSNAELQAKSQVQVFFSEKDVKGDFSVISVNLYSPYTIPILMNYRKQMSKKFLQKAVMKANEQGGNGIIVTAGGYYKVIKIKNWDSDSEKPATYVNLIFDKKLMNKFNNGEVAKMAKSDVKRYEDMFINEIIMNIENAKTLEETAAIREKVNALKSYNTSLRKPKERISDEIDDMESDLTKLEKRINKRLAKEKK